MKVNDAGFTLVELLIAMSILAGVTVVLTSAIGLTRRAMANMTAVRTNIDEVERLRTVLGSPLRQVVSHDAPVAFAGTERELRFTTPAAPPLSYAGDVVLTVKPDHDGAAAEWRELPPRTALITHALLQRGDTVEFSYFSPRTGWTPIWSKATALPSMVRATITHLGNQLSETKVEFPVSAIAPIRCVTAAHCESTP